MYVHDTRLPSLTDFLCLSFYPSQGILSDQAFDVKDITFYEILQ